MLQPCSKNTIYICFLTLLIIPCIKYSQNLEGDYLGQKPAGTTPEVFAPDIMSTKAHEHSSPTFSPDGNEVYWSVWPEGNFPQAIMYMRRINNKWSSPKIADFSGKFNDGGPFLSLDGKRLLFYSKRPLQGNNEKDNDIWYVEREDTTWSDPINIGNPINSDKLEAMPTISKSGNLFFVSYYHGVQGEYGIYKSFYSGNNYEKPKPLNKTINSKNNDWCPFIAPDESYLLFSSNRSGGYGSFDLYICFQESDGSWSEPMNMGNKINTSKQERFPSVSSDGKYIFFTRATPENRDDIFWVSAVIIDSLYNIKTNIDEIDGVLKNYHSYVSDFMEKSNAPGVAIAIVVDSQILYIKGFGVRKVGEMESIDAHTVFRIASLSKGFASVLTGLLVKDGVLKWDDKVTKYLPDFSLKNTSNTNNLTIRHILSHTSGLMPHAYDNMIEANVPFETIIKKLKGVSIICPVGECYGYQNVVYSLISEIIESTTNREYNDLLKERLFQPLGMQDMSFSKNKLHATKNRAYPHIKRNGKWIPTIIKETYYNVQPAAGINSSAYDMALWLKGLLGGMPHILSSDIMEEICKPIIRTPREMRRFNWNNRLRNAYYGMGWRIFDYSGHTMIFHSGGIHGYQSKLAFLPKHKIGIVVLQNGWFDNCFIYKFFDLYLNKIK